MKRGDMDGGEVMVAKPRKLFSFATMMVLAQRRHAARMTAHQPLTDPEREKREQAMRRTLQKMNGTKRLVVFMYPA